MTLNLAGSILQVQTTVVTAKTATVTSVYPTYSNWTSLAVTITPKYTTSTILVTVNLYVGNSRGAGAASDNFTYTGLNTTGTLIAVNAENSLGTIYTTKWDMCILGSFSYLISPASVSAQTYQVAGAVASASTSYLNQRGVGDGVYPGVSTITAMEIAA